MYNQAGLFYRLSIIVTYLCFIEHFTHAGTYDIWSPKYGNRSYLVCPLQLCEDIQTPQKDKRQRCCICNAEPIWSVPIDNTVHLKLEYIVFADHYTTDLRHSHFTLIHNHGFMRTIPNDICSFDRIVTIELRHNKL